MSFIRNIFDTINNNLISGDAYYIIIKSVFTTIAITILAFILTFLLGGLVSYFMSYEKKIISGLAKSISFIFRSTPALLLMLLFYYVFLKSSHINTVVIAGISLGLYGAGHFAEILTKGVLDAQKRQDMEVTKRLKHVYYSIALPQAMEETRFYLKRLVIHILQWTSVSGFISVNDLTEVMNRIGQRTMYPFFSIFVSIIFYLVLTIIVEGIFGGIEKVLTKRDE